MAKAKERAPKKAKRRVYPQLDNATRKELRETMNGFGAEWVASECGLSAGVLYRALRKPSTSATIRKIHEGLGRLRKANPDDPRPVSNGQTVDLVVRLKLTVKELVSLTQEASTAGVSPEALIVERVRESLREPPGEG